MDWSKTQKNVYAWSRNTFKDSTMESNLDHLRDELNEIVENPNDIEEWADVIMLYMNAASFAGHSMDDILVAVNEKLEKNKKRKWGEPDERGVVKHIEETDFLDILIYSTPTCGFCRRAKQWLTERGYEFEEVMLDNEEAITRFKEDCPGKTSVPQIFIDGELIEGGYQGLIELDI